MAMLKIYRLMSQFVMAIIILMVCAASACAANDQQKLSIISWNVWFDDSSGEDRYPLILDELKSQKTDVVLLQEVTPAFLHALRLHPVSKNYFITLTDESMAYQNIVLTRQRPQNKKVLALNSQMQRKALLVQLQLPNQDELLAVVNVHLESSLDAQRLRQQQLSQILLTVKNEPNLIMGGDFNFGNGSEEEAVISRSLQELAKGSRYISTPTYDVEKNPWADQTKYWFESSRRLDRIYYRFMTEVKFSYSLIGQLPSPITKKHLSDHFGVKADIVIPLRNSSAHREMKFITNAITAL